MRRKILALFILSLMGFFVIAHVFAQDNSQNTDAVTGNATLIEDGGVQDNNTLDEVEDSQIIRSGIIESQTYKNITIDYGFGKYGAPFLFQADAPNNIQLWSISIAEAGGNVIFEDSGTQWSAAGYSWTPAEDVFLQSGIYYIFTLSFSNERGVVQTQALKFFTKVQISENKSPLIFFNGNTTVYNTSIYDENLKAEEILDFVAESAKSEFATSRILIRGHATYVTNTIEERKKEYYELLDLSQKRAVKVLRRLVQRGVREDRLSYEALGGSEEITTIESEKWKNRRVEIVFLSDGQYYVPRENVNDDIRNDIDENSNVLQEESQVEEIIPEDEIVEDVEEDSENDIVDDSDSYKQFNNNTVTPDDVDNENLRDFEEKIEEDKNDIQAYLSEEAAKKLREEAQRTIDEAGSERTGLPRQDKYFNLNREDEIANPWPDVPILGDGQLSINEMLAFLLYNSPGLSREYARRIVSYYIIEADREKVNHDIAFAQMLLETEYLQFRGVIRKVQYNFAGIGTVDRNDEGNWFSTEQIGVRAHIQHLKGYATTQALVGDIVDPTYAILERYGLLGSAPLVESLSGRWASDPEYGTKIRKILRRMYNFANAWSSAKNQ